jgi:hypothetical protein
MAGHHLQQLFRSLAGRRGISASERCACLCKQIGMLG